jgi:hypothetical protein
MPRPPAEASKISREEAKTMIRRSVVLALLATLTTAALAGPATAATTAAGRTQSPNRLQTGLPISGTCTNENTGQVGTFTGTLKVTRFAYQSGVLVAQGLLSGTCSAGGSITDVPVTFPVDIPNATCRILLLELGPIHLDLLGLVVDTSPITVLITAVSGPGNLLGNLLCAIAGLLDQDPLMLLDNLLNALLALFSP